MQIQVCYQKKINQISPNCYIQEVSSETKKASWVDHMRIDLQGHNF